MLDKQEVKALVTKATKAIDLYSPEVVELLMGTCAQESTMGKYRKQLGNGPALGIFQMEPFTYYDCYNTFLRYKPQLLAKILAASGLDEYPNSAELVDNDVFSACMARVRYLRAPGAIPKTLEKQAAYWKKHYNTIKGKGKVEEYIENYKKYCL